MNTEPELIEGACEDEEQEKASQALNEILEILNKYKLRTQDLILLYGNLGYSIGASIEGMKNSVGPTVEELQKSYYEKPTVGIAMMLQGLLTTTWQDDILKTNQEANEEKK